MVFYKEWLSKKQFLGVLFSCFGVIVIITKGQVAALLDLQLNSGDVWILAAVMSWTSYSILLRYKPLEISGLSLLAANIFIGNLIIYPFVYWELQHTQIKAFDVSSEIVISVFYLAIFPSLLAYLFWNKAVSQIGAAKASLFIHLLPVFGTILASIFLSEQLKVFHLIGIVLIFMGIYLAVITDIMQRIKLAKSNKYQ
jgi:drug/metabolite transporter (DMT)-like permease